VSSIPSAGVVIASGGNAGLANAYAAAVLGVRATVFVPETAPLVKIDRIREYGADVRQVGTEYAEAHDAAIDYANARGALLNHAYDGVAADSLGARRVGEIAFSMASRVTPTSVLLDDDAIVSARLHLWREYRIPAEHGAATAFAALSSGAYHPAAGERVAVVVCGANTDVRTLEPE
jgi:threonine dehydratase